MNAKIKKDLFFSEVDKIIYLQLLWNKLIVEIEKNN